MHGGFQSFTTFCPPFYWLNLITRTRARLSLLPINFIINAQISTQQSICSAKAKERWVCRWRWATYLSDYWPQIWCLPPLSMLSFHYTFIASRRSPRDVSPWCAKTPSMLFPSTHGSEVRCAPHSKIAIFILLSYFSHPNNNVYLKHNPRSLSHSQPQHNEQKVNPPGVKNRKISLPQQEQAERASANNKKRKKIPWKRNENEMRRAPAAESNELSRENPYWRKGGDWQTKWNESDCEHVEMKMFHLLLWCFALLTPPDAWRHFVIKKHRRNIFIIFFLFFLCQLDACTREATLNSKSWKILCFL